MKKENEKCIWVGIGLDVSHQSNLYRQVLGMQRVLVTKYGSKKTFSASQMPHVNLYDLSVPAQNLDMIHERIHRIAQDQKGIRITATKVHYFSFGQFFLEIVRDKKLQQLHEKVVREIVLLKGECIDEDYLRRERRYEPEQKSILLKYGNPFVLQYFRPHISIGFIQNQTTKMARICDELNMQIESQEHFFDTLHVVTQIGKHRTMKNIRMGKNNIQGRNDKIF